jgi:predicted HTH transcriptional regulator
MTTVIGASHGDSCRFDVSPSPTHYPQGEEIWNMNKAKLLQILARGEDSRHQFKRDETNADSIAAELAAFANTGGGMLLLGVEDKGRVAGLDAASVRRLNQLISNAASQNIRPPIHPTTENVQAANGMVIVVTVPDGLSKPYLGNQGRIWVKVGSDKRHVTAREEIQRLFQRSGLIYADVIPVERTSAADIDEKAFDDYFNRRYGKLPQSSGQPLSQVLQNIGLADGLELNLAGLLLFGRRPQRFRPAFMVKAVAFPGTVLHDTRYLDSEDIDGTLLEQYQRSLAFIKRNLHHVQAGRDFNTLGQLEVPEAAIVELLVNAFIHRDYFTSASIRIMVFADRIEMMSPGHLPDSLNIEAIRHGITNRRNPTLTEHATHILPYRGLGSGIPRALGEWSNIRFEDDVEGNQFKVVIARPRTVAPEVAPEVTPEVTPEVKRLLAVLQGEMSREQIMALLRLRDEKHFRVRYQQAAIAAGLIEMTLPDKPRSRLQRYRLTATGQRWLDAHSSGGSKRL